MNITTSYLFLVLAVLLGVTSNNFAKSAEGFTLAVPSIVTAITIVLCMYALSVVMKSIPMGITYASFAGLTIISTVVVGMIKYNQIPNMYTAIGLVFIIIGVLMVNLLSGKNP
jgi:small multidrug resistance pump